MKQLKNIILEKLILNKSIKKNKTSEEIEKALEDCALVIIDYFNQEGVADFDEQDWKDYINGNKEPDYKKIVDAMIDELEEYGDKDDILSILKKYNTDEWKESIEIAILKAAEYYTRDIFNS